MQHSKAHFARAVVEGITFSLVQVLYALETTYHPVNSIYASGAITQSAWWMQLLADVSGRPVIYQDAPDASALGAAMLGMYATGVISSLGQSRQFLQPARCFIPIWGSIRSTAGNTRPIPGFTPTERLFLRSMFLWRQLIASIGLHLRCLSREERFGIALLQF